MTLDMSGMTWTCHICKRERPDAAISVRSHERVHENGVKMIENVRYCNDRLSCAVGAETFSFMGSD